MTATEAVRGPGDLDDDRRGMRDRLESRTHGCEKPEADRNRAIAEACVRTDGAVRQEVGPLEVSEDVTKRDCAKRARR